MPNGYQGSPTESSFFAGWAAPPVADAGISLFAIQVNADRDFGGRTISEADAGGGTDGCWYSGSPYPKQTAVTGGTWYVGSFGYNTTGYDYVGWFDEAIRFYQAGRPSMGLPMPCQANLPQNMLIWCNASPNQIYKFNYLYLAIDVAQVSNTRDNVWSGWKGYTP